MNHWPFRFLLLLALIQTGFADSIHFKNGTTITADKVTENAENFEYTIGNTRYSVPKSSVSSIEHGSSFGISIGTSKSGVIAAPSDPGTNFPAASTSQKLSRKQLAAALSARPQMHGVELSSLYPEIVSFNRINERALYDIEGEGNPAKAAAAYFIAAQYAYEHGAGEAARNYMKRCVEFAPEQVALLEWYSLLLLDGGQYQEAVAQAERAVQKAPTSAEALQVLGLAYYDSGRFDDAIDKWKRAQEIQPTQSVAAYLAKAERESSVEGKFSEREGAHFVLRYEGHQAGFRFASELLYTLENEYRELQGDLGFSPDGSITVILYTQQQFFDVTQAPAWSAGLNDGKIRIPVRDLSGVTPQLEAVLRHEMTHSFVHALTRGRCPTWLNEGLAQIEERRSSAANSATLAQLFQAGRQAPLRVLEGSFTRFSPVQAQVAYAESLAATEYLRSSHGAYALRRMLDLLSDGEEPEAALREATQANYAEFERGLGAYLANNAR